MLGLGREVCATVLQLRDLCVRILRVRPVVVGPLLLALPIEPGPLGASRGSDTGRLRELGQPRLVRRARVPAHEAPHRRVGFQGGRIDSDRVPLDQVGLGQPLQHPGEHRLMGFEVQQAACARQRRVVRRGLVQREVEKGADTQRISRAPRDGPLRVQALKVPKQQQSEIAPPCQTRPPDAVGIERRALRLDEVVEARVVEDAIQPGIERLAGTRRQIRCGDPHTRLSVPRPLLPHRHAPEYKNEDEFWLMI